MTPRKPKPKDVMISANELAAMSRVVLSARDLVRHGSKGAGGRLILECDCERLDWALEIYDEIARERKAGRGK